MAKIRGSALGASVSKRRRRSRRRVFVFRTGPGSAAVSEWAPPKER